MTQVLLVPLMVAWSMSVYTLSQPSCGFTAMTLAWIHPLPGMLLFSTFQLFPRPFKAKLISHCHELWFVSLIFTLDKMSSFLYSSVVVNKFIKNIEHNFTLELQPHLCVATSQCLYIPISRCCGFFSFETYSVPLSFPTTVKHLTPSLVFTDH